ISAAILLSISGTFIYKHTFTNPLGIDNEFYKERVHVYEIVMTAYNEKREFTPFETREIEDILGEVLDDTGKTEDDYENEDEFFLDLDISIMYLKYKIAMNNIWDDSERSKKLK